MVDVGRHGRLHQGAPDEAVGGPEPRREVERDPADSERVKTRLLELGGTRKTAHAAPSATRATSMTEGAQPAFAARVGEAAQAHRRSCGRVPGDEARFLADLVGAHAAAQAMEGTAPAHVDHDGHASSSAVGGAAVDLSPRRRRPSGRRALGPVERGGLVHQSPTVMAPSTCRAMVLPTPWRVGVGGDEDFPEEWRAAWWWW